MIDYFGDFETWLHDVAEDKTFRIWRVRKLRTEEEPEKKFIDKYAIVNQYCDLVEVIPLGGHLNEAKDYLLGFRDKWISDNKIESEKLIQYYKLSDIQLNDITEVWKNQLKEYNII